MKTSVVFFALFAYLNVCRGGDLAFIKIGTHYGETPDNFLYAKTFFVPRYFRAFWQDAFMLCRSFDMEMATLDTLAEYDSVNRMLNDLTTPMSDWLHIGGITRTPKSTIDWYWVHSEERVNYTMSWAHNEPGFHSERQFCLAIGSKKRGEVGKFADIDCHLSHANEAFMCQKLEFIRKNAGM